MITIRDYNKGDAPEVGRLIAGVLRGRDERLASFFVHKDYHHKGVGRKLVATFEGEMIARSISVIRMAATEYAVPFYTKMGYKKSTGLRTRWSFESYGLPYQPTKKKQIGN